MCLCGCSSEREFIGSVPLEILYSGNCQSQCGEKKEKYFTDETADGPHVDCYHNEVYFQAHQLRALISAAYWECSFPKYKT